MSKFWIARDSDKRGFDESLSLYIHKPKRGNYCWFDAVAEGEINLLKDDPWGDGLTWESDPRELDLVEEEQVDFWREEAEKYKRALERACKKLNYYNFGKDVGQARQWFLTKAEQELKTTNQS